MSREARLIISRAIVVVVYLISMAAAALGNFMYTVVAASAGLILWLIYLAAADLGRAESVEDRTSLGRSLTLVLAGLGLILAVSALGTYGLKQNIFGGYDFNITGVAVALGIVLVTVLPLLVMQLLAPRASREQSPATMQTDAAAHAPELAEQIQGSQPVYGAPYSPAYELYPDELLDEEDEEEDEEYETDEDQDEDGDYEEYEEDED